MGLYRIIEIEWAVKNDKEFVPSPKRPKKAKSKKKGKSTSGSGLKVELVEPIIAMADVKMEVDETDVKPSFVGSMNKGKRKKFGSEATNRSDEADEDEDMETPSKRQRLGEYTGSEARSPPDVPKKSKREVATKQ